MGLKKIAGVTSQAREHLTQDPRQSYVHVVGSVLCTTAFPLAYKGTRSQCSCKSHAESAPPHRIGHPRQNNAASQHVGQPGWCRSRWWYRRCGTLGRGGRCRVLGWGRRRRVWSRDGRSGAYCRSGRCRVGSRGRRSGAWGNGGRCRVGSRGGRGRALGGDGCGRALGRCRRRDMLYWCSRAHRCWPAEVARLFIASCRDDTHEEYTATKMMPR